MPNRPAIPIVPRGDESASSCGAAEPFALMVLGDSMAPEFSEGDVIVVEPEGLATDGAFVVAHVNGEYVFRRLLACASGWRLCALAPGHPMIEINDLACVRGVVIQKSRPGRRRATRLYGPGGRR